MTDLKSDEPGIGEPTGKEKDASKKGGARTSRNRGENVEEAGQDGFQRPDTSGTIGLGGESESSDPNRGPGGVEGPGGNE